MNHMSFTSITIPNLYSSQLAWFFKHNWPQLKKDILNHELELIVVSHGLNETELKAYQKRYPKVKFLAPNRSLLAPNPAYRQSRPAYQQVGPHSRLPTLPTGRQVPTPNSQLSRAQTGFAPTVNRGFRSAAKTADWYGTVNDDVILSAGWLRRLLQRAEKFKKVGSINPVILNPLNSQLRTSSFQLPTPNSELPTPNSQLSTSFKIESAGIRILPIGKAMPITQIMIKPTVVDATNAACVLYRAEALKQVGFFDEKFISYLEDIDLALRLKRAGWLNLVIPDVTVIHQRHATSQKSLSAKRRAWLNLRNWWFVILKNWSWQWWLKYGPQILLERGRNFSGWLKAAKKH